VIICSQCKTWVQTFLNLRLRANNELKNSDESDSESKNVHIDNQDENPRFDSNVSIAASTANDEYVKHLEVEIEMLSTKVKLLESRLGNGSTADFRSSGSGSIDAYGYDDESMSSVSTSTLTRNSTRLTLSDNLVNGNGNIGTNTSTNTNTSTYAFESESAYPASEVGALLWAFGPQREKLLDKL